MHAASSIGCSMEPSYSISPSSVCVWSVWHHRTLAIRTTPLFLAMHVLYYIFLCASPSVPFSVFTAMSSCSFPLQPLSVPLYTMPNSPRCENNIHVYILFSFHHSQVISTEYYHKGNICICSKEWCSRFELNAVDSVKFDTSECTYLAQHSHVSGCFS